MIKTRQRARFFDERGARHRVLDVAVGHDFAFSAPRFSAPRFSAPRFIANRTPRKKLFNRDFARQSHIESAINETGSAAPNSFAQRESTVLQGCFGRQGEVVIVRMRHMEIGICGDNLRPPSVSDGL